MPLTCPRCQRTNPDQAAFCWNDGIDLRSGAEGKAVFGKMAQEFVFPSGRTCRTFDELVQVCQEEWEEAKELLQGGAFRQFFMSSGRADLVKANNEAMALPDPDMGLTTFLDALPFAKRQSPRLDLHPRRLLLGSVPAGEMRQLQMTVSNQGQGILQGTMTVSEGAEWLRLGNGASATQFPLKTSRDQQITLQVDTRGLAAAKTYAGKLTVATNGGIVEVPVRLDLAAHPFPQAPFQGVRAPREMAEKMRTQPKAAGPLLENGEVSRWFASNGWNFPVRGTLAKGVAGVQQFFEAMGLSKPPVVQVKPAGLRVQPEYPRTVRGQVSLQTTAKKWVYAGIESDSPWLTVLTPQVAGPREATIGFEVDSRQLPRNGPVEGSLKVIANAGQKLSVRVRAEARGMPAPKGVGLLQPMAAFALVFVLVRLLLIPVADFLSRPSAAQAAAVKLNQMPDPDAPLAQTGGWLLLPWPSILLGSDTPLPESVFGSGARGTVSGRDFRHYFASHFIRSFVAWTWWVGAVLGGLIVWRRGGKLIDLPWGVIAGAFGGVVLSATVACLLLLMELVPHLVVSGSGFGAILVWILVALVWWIVLGLVVGMVLGMIAPLRSGVVEPLQNFLAGVFYRYGLRGLGDWFVV